MFSGKCGVNETVQETFPVHINIINTFAGFSCNANLFVLCFYSLPCRGRVLFSLLSLIGWKSVFGCNEKRFNPDKNTSVIPTVYGFISLKF